MKTKREKTSLELKRWRLLSRLEQTWLASCIRRFNSDKYKSKKRKRKDGRKGNGSNSKLKSLPKLKNKKRKSEGQD